MKKVFILSPAKTSGERAAMLFRPEAKFDLEPLLEFFGKRLLFIVETFFFAACSSDNENVAAIHRVVHLICALLAGGAVGAAAIPVGLAGVTAAPVDWRDHGGGVRFHSRVVIPSG